MPATWNFNWSYSRTISKDDRSSIFEFRPRSKIKNFYHVWKIAKMRFFHSPDSVIGDSRIALIPNCRARRALSGHHWVFCSSYYRFRTITVLKLKIARFFIKSAKSRVFNKSPFFAHTFEAHAMPYVRIFSKVEISKNWPSYSVGKK